MSKDNNIPKLKDADIVIFGGQGDLAMRKIFPAIYHRFKAKQINNNSRVFVISRGDVSQTEFKANLKEKLTNNIQDVDQKIVAELLKLCKYIQADLTQESSLAVLKDDLREDDNIVRVYYFSVSSSIFGDITRNLHAEKLITPESRVVLEKPLGQDSASSKLINSEISNYFEESQIFRIDHYLGKETVQNLMVLRFANNLYENAWNSQNIENVQITVAEDLGVSSRGGYYDKYGALLDMVQNHLLQLLCLVAMEPPSVLEANNVRDEKLKVLKALRLFDDKMVLDQTVKGQYTRGSINGESVKSYLEDINDFQSDTETFVAIRANIDNWRWAGVPFYLRTGKRMSKKHSEIVINFKNIPHNIFPNSKPIVNNKLIISLQPEERIELVQTVKIPGPGGYRYKPTSLVLDYSTSFQDRLPEAYERLLIDVIRGNQTLFMRKDEVEASWTWIDTITKYWKQTKMTNNLYNSGTTGPGDKILIDGHTWNI
ncbi:MAG: glucose-6-phosphate dehydrogenase [Flavobacteriales bacterium]|nr:glucose-6-phosphate dehydrogenase [Flavobacteriales bacterium]MDG1395928.1 glucose-6-phosphate dehydrogenase [Flavobacteriales bacterium]